MKTVKRGIAELDLLEDDPAAGRVRRPGAGRKKKLKRDQPKKRTWPLAWKSGQPDEEDVVFTDLSPRQLSERLGEMGTPVGRDAIATWLDDAEIRRRQIRKDRAGGEHPDRDAQFGRIAELVDQYESAGNPWFSMDTKAKEHLGELFRTVEAAIRPTNTSSSTIYRN